jgi:hypothetical protein
VCCDCLDCHAVILLLAARQETRHAHTASSERLCLPRPNANHALTSDCFDAQQKLRRFAFPVPARSRGTWPPTHVFGADSAPDTFQRAPLAAGDDFGRVVQTIRVDHCTRADSTEGTAPIAPPSNGPIVASLCFRARAGSSLFVHHTCQCKQRQQRGRFTCCSEAHANTTVQQ